MNFELLKQKALSMGINEIEVYESKTTQTSITTFNDNVESNVVSNSIGIALRGVCNNQITTIYTEDQSDEVLNEILLAIKNNTLLINKNEPYFIFGGSEKYHVLEEVKDDFDQYNLDDKVQLCLKMNTLAREKSNYVTNVSCKYQEVYANVSIVNTSGLNVSKAYSYAYTYANVVCFKDNENKTSFELKIFNNLKDLDIDKLVTTAVNDAVSQFGAKPVESKKYKVLFKNDTFTSLLGAFTGSFSAETVIKKLSFLEGKLGEKVFGENITIVDDPFDKRAPFQSSFDDEGVATFKKTVIEKGVLKTYLHNLKTAKMMETTSTGNGFVSSVGDPVKVAHTNLIVECGKKSFDEVVKEINEGIYLTSLQGLHSGVVPVNGNFSLQCSGYKITDGKIGEPVTLIIVSGNIIELLNNVVEIANDFECGFSIGSGSVYVSSLSISGN